MQLPNFFHMDVPLLEWRLKTAQFDPGIIYHIAKPTPSDKKEDPIQQIIQKAIEASCTIVVRSAHGEWTGSGFHLGEGLVATASHVAPPQLSQSSQIGVTFDGSNFFPAQIAVSDPNVDSAILYCPQARSISGVHLADSNVAEVGDIIAVIGSPEGWHDTATVGRISNTHQELGTMAPSAAWNDIIFIDADILQGVSGGMVIGTDGLVYGSVMGVTGEYANLGIGERAVCPSNKIRTLLTALAQGAPGGV